jgi:hypothetical protein
MKLNISKEELQHLYEKELDDYLEQCDWVTYVRSEVVCGLVSTALGRLDVEIDSQGLHKIYSSEIEALNLKDGEWNLRFGVKEIIEMIYDIIEKNF